MPVVRAGARTESVIIHRIGIMNDELLLWTVGQFLYKTLLGAIESRLLLARTIKPYEIDFEKSCKKERRLIGITNTREARGDAKKSAQSRVA